MQMERERHNKEGVKYRMDALKDHAWSHTTEVNAQGFESEENMTQPNSERQRSQRLAIRLRAENDVTKA